MAVVCRTCPYQRECLILGLYEATGIWGGLTTSKRVKLRRVGGPALRCEQCGSLYTWETLTGQVCGECGHTQERPEP